MSHAEAFNAESMEPVCTYDRGVLISESSLVAMWPLLNAIRTAGPVLQPFMCANIQKH
jgi:hypothetical protein